VAENYSLADNPSVAENSATQCLKIARAAEKVQSTAFRDLWELPLVYLMIQFNR